MQKNKFIRRVCSCENLSALAENFPFRSQEALFEPRKNTRCSSGLEYHHTVLEIKIIELRGVHSLTTWQPHTPRAPLFECAELG